MSIQMSSRICSAQDTWTFFRKSNPRSESNGFARFSFWCTREQRQVQPFLSLLLRYRARLVTFDLPLFLDSCHNHFR